MRSAKRLIHRPRRRDLPFIQQLARLGIEGPDAVFRRGGEDDLPAGGGERVHERARPMLRNVLKMDGQTGDGREGSENYFFIRVERCIP